MIGIYVNGPLSVMPWCSECCPTAEQILDVTLVKFMLLAALKDSGRNASRYICDFHVSLRLIDLRFERQPGSDG